MALSAPSSVPSGLGDFYRERVLELVRWVDSWPPHRCPADLQAYVRDFDRLPVAAQRLWARLLLRKGPRFIVSDLTYEEVGDPAGPVLALVLGGVVGGRCDCGCDSVSGTRDVTDRDSLYSVSSCPERKRRILRFMSWVRDGPFFSLVVGARISCS